MIIEINNKKTIGKICEEFSLYYPFLKLEFYVRPHGWQEPSSYRDVIPHDKSIEEVNGNGHEGLIEIHYWQKTGNIEREFDSRFGLHVQVLRKQNDKWIQSSGTDELTLEEQNEAGRKSSEASLHGTDRKLNL